MVDGSSQYITKACETGESTTFCRDKTVFLLFWVEGTNELCLTLHHPHVLHGILFCFPSDTPVHLRRTCSFVCGALICRTMETYSKRSELLLIRFHSCSPNTPYCLSELSNSLQRSEQNHLCDPESNSAQARPT